MKILLISLITCLLFQSCLNNKTTDNVMQQEFDKTPIKEYELGGKYANGSYTDSTGIKRDTLITISQESDLIFPFNYTQNLTANFIDNQKNLLAKSDIQIKSSGKRWQFDSSQREVFYRHEIIEIESTKLKSILGNYGFNYKNKDNIIYSSSGVLEDNQEIFIHPCRSDYLQILEFAPFPRIKFPIDKNKTWSNRMTLGEGWGNFTGTTVTTTYKIQELESDSQNNPKKITITSSAKSNLGVVQGIIIFESNEFKSFEYTFPNGEILLLISK